MRFATVLLGIGLLIGLGAEAQLVSDTDTVCNARCLVKGDTLYPNSVIDHTCYFQCINDEKFGYRGAAPRNPPVLPSGNNRAFILLASMLYELGNTGVLIEVPAGFVTDYASVPERLWSLYSPHDQYSRAAVIHDYLYWTQLCTKEQADNIFMIAMKESEVPKGTRDAVYWGVAKWGKPSWEKNEMERLAGMPRFVPIEKRDFPPNESWETYRAQLKAQGAIDPVVAHAVYCTFGNSQEVPKLAGKPYLTSFGAPAFVERKKVLPTPAFVMPKICLFGNC